MLIYRHMALSSVQKSFCILLDPTLYFKLVSLTFCLLLFVRTDIYFEYAYIIHTNRKNQIVPQI